MPVGIPLRPSLQLEVQMDVMTIHSLFGNNDFFARHVSPATRERGYNIEPNHNIANQNNEKSNNQPHTTPNDDSSTLLRIANTFP